MSVTAISDWLWSWAVLKFDALALECGTVYYKNWNILEVVMLAAWHSTVLQQYILAATRILEQVNHSVLAYRLFDEQMRVRHVKTQTRDVPSPPYNDFSHLYACLMAWQVRCA